MMLPDRKYDEWSQQDHKDRDYSSEVERKFFGAVENPSPAPAQLKELYREFGKFLGKEEN
jgi:hypothetical protein